jgi:hypothetical protein
LVKKKRARLSGVLLPHKRGIGFSPLIAPTPDEMENPIPMDITPKPSLQLPARSYFKASRKRKKTLASASIVTSAVLVNEDSINLGDHVVSLSSIRRFFLETAEGLLVQLQFEVSRH